ncbi:MAG: crossover junction endodeoxyribonuclease RuvC [Candidatus Omnitrophica bacterium]|nr:crossover junction endodeoxyribonuclease RuvC [Candidatus Omnitrophota bacterium]
MKILGVDPGLRVTGYGVIEYPEGGVPKLVEAGVIRTGDKDGIAARLEELYTCLSDVIAELKPDVMVLEKLYAHYKHPATAILMGHARGVVCLLSGTRKVPLVNIASTRVKKAVTGKGHAPKAQVQRMVQHTLGLACLPEPPDVADALAAAISYAQSRRHDSSTRSPLATSLGMTLRTR